MTEPLQPLTVATVERIHAEVLRAHGGSPGLRDKTLLESAVAAPHATMLGEPLLRDPVEIAAAYLFYLCRNHPFVDGNKRTALAAGLVFLERNHLLPHEELPVAPWEEFVLDIASSKLDRDGVTQRFRELLGELRP